MAAGGDAVNQPLAVIAPEDLQALSLAQGKCHNNAIVMLKNQML